MSSRTRTTAPVEASETTEVMAEVVAEHTDLATTTTATIGRGLENVNMEEVAMPRAKLLQSNSPEVSDRDYNFRAGDLVHTLMMEKVPSTFIPISIFTSNILFVPRSEEKKPAFKGLLNLSDEDMQGIVVCKASDGKHGDRYGECVKCGKHKFNGNEKPLCTETINVLALPIDEDGIGLPFVVQFSNTSFKHGKKFRDTAVYASLGADLFAKVYKFDTVEAAGNGNKWFELKVKPAGLVPEEYRARVEAMYDSFAGKVVVVDAEDDIIEENGDY